MADKVDWDAALDEAEDRVEVKRTLLRIAWPTLSFVLPFFVAFGGVVALILSYGFLKSLMTAVLK